MSNLSIRCQRAAIVSSQGLNISEVLEVMNEHDLMDLLRAKTDGDLDQLTFTLTTSANIAGRAGLYSTLSGRDKAQFNFEEPTITRDERASSSGSKSTSLDLFPNIAAISSTDEIDLPNDEDYVDESKTHPSPSNGTGNSNGLSLFGGITAMLAIRRLSAKKDKEKEKEKEKEDYFSDIRTSSDASPSTAAAAIPTPSTTAAAAATGPSPSGPEKKSFLQRAFGFMSSEATPTSDPEEDIESGVNNSRLSRRENKQNGLSQESNQQQQPSSSPSSSAAAAATQQQGKPLSPQSTHTTTTPQTKTNPSPTTSTQTKSPQQPQRNIVQPRNVVQPSPRNITQPLPLPPPPTNTSADPNPPRPHSLATPSSSHTSTPQPTSITDDMKRRHSISTSRALAQEALKVAQARKTSLNERVSGSKNTLASTTSAASASSSANSPSKESTTGLSYDRIYAQDQGISNKEEVIIETNHQILGLNRHRESEIQRQNRLSQSSTTIPENGNDDDDEDSENEKQDQFTSHSNPLLANKTRPPSSTTITPSTTTNSTVNTSTLPSSNTDEPFEPDNSARALEKRRRSTRFPSIKGKRELFLMRSETGSSVGSNASVEQHTTVTTKTTESQSTGEGSGLSGASNTSPVTVESALSRRISRKYVTSTSNNEDFTDKVTKFYSYNELKRPALMRTSSSLSSTGDNDEDQQQSQQQPPPYAFPSDVNPKYREQYLTEDEFETIFHMTKSAFNSQPKWKKQELKKRHHLF